MLQSLTSCAGCAIFVVEASREAFQTFANDHELNRFATKSKIFLLDPSKDEYRQMLSEKGHNVRPNCTHMSLPAGTALMAGEKPVTDKLRRHGTLQPRLRRDRRHTLGLDNLTELRCNFDACHDVYLSAESVIFPHLCARLVGINQKHPERSGFRAISGLADKEWSDAEYADLCFGLMDTTWMSTYAAAKIGNNGFQHSC